MLSSAGPLAATNADILKGAQHARCPASKPSCLCTTSWLRSMVYTWKTLHLRQAQQTNSMQLCI